jgi:hypothetical protein
VFQGINNTSKVEIKLSIGSKGKPFAYIDEIHNKGNIVTSSRMKTRKIGPSYLLFFINWFLLLSSLSNPLLLHDKN